MCGEETVKATDLIPAKSNRNFQVMIWGYICWHGVGALSKVTGIINLKSTETFSRTTFNTDTM